MNIIKMQNLIVTSTRKKGYFKNKIEEIQCGGWVGKYNDVE